MKHISHREQDRQTAGFQRIRHVPSDTATLRVSRLPQPCAFSRFLAILVAGELMDSATRRITQESLNRANEAIVNGEIEGAEFEVWWESLRRAYNGMQPPKTWQQIKRVTEAALDAENPNQVYDVPGDYGS
jgi:hypothetical protein